MGKYDIDAKLTEECKLTLADLIQELMEERKDVKKGGLSEGAYRQAFNNKKSGLIPKIKKATGIDLDIYIKGKNKEEKFDALKILKCFYEIEKDGTSKNKGGYGSNSRVRITEILNEPQLQNINSIYTSQSVYGDVFEDLYNKVGDNAKHRNYITKKIESIELRWSVISHRVVSFYRKWECQINEDKAMEELTETDNYLVRLKEYLIEIRKFLEREKEFEEFLIKTTPEEEQIKTIWQIIKDRVILESELTRIRGEKEREEKELGVMDKLFLALEKYKVLCMQIDKINANQGSIEDINLPDDYTKRYHLWYGKRITRDKWAKVINYFSNYPENIDRETEELVYLILYGRKNLSAEEIKKYRYAVKNVWTLMEIIREDGNISGDKDIRRYVDEIMYGRLEKCKQKQIDIFISSAKGLVRQDILEGQIFIALVQEIFFVSYNPFDRGRKEEKIDISYYGYTNKTQTLSSVLKKENVKYQSPIAVLAWVRRIESRSLINNGVPKKVLMKRKEVEKKILDIQRELYNNQTITVFDFFSNDVINHLESIFSN